MGWESTVEVKSFSVKILGHTYKEESRFRFFKNLTQSFNINYINKNKIFQLKKMNVLPDLNLYKVNDDEETNQQIANTL